MSWIQNISKQRILDGDHISPGKNSMLIQIIDSRFQFPNPKFKFKEVHQFAFGDFEEEDDWENIEKITDNQVENLIECLKHALINDMNVLVHCSLGTSRSGAVCAVGVEMGFKDRKTYRNPNALVKNKMLKLLGISCPEEE